MEHITFTTPLPNDFLDIYLHKVNPIFCIIYIYSLRQFAKGIKTLSIEEVAATFDILASDVVKALDYWEKTKLVKIISKSEDYVSLLFVSTNVNIDKTDDIKIDNVAKKFDTSPNKNDFEEGIESEKATNFVVSPVRDLPHYSIEDVELRLTDKEVQRLFYIAETLQGKLLTDIERKMLLGFYDDLGLSVDVIEVLIDYCVANNKKNHSYMKTVAYDWADMQISTVEQAEEYINRFTSQYVEIFKYFGITNREPIKREIKVMDAWLEAWPLEVIREACEKTIIQKGSMNLKYAGGIFESWKKNNITTLEQIKQLDKEYYDNIKEVKVKQKDNKEGSNQSFFGKDIKRKAAKNNQYTYEGRTWDYDKIEELERKRNQL